MKASIGFNVAKKKTPYQKHKAAEEEKKKKAEQEAAKIYEQFVESFQGEEAPEDGPPARRQRSDTGPRTFTRGGTVMPGQSAEEHAAPSGRGGRYSLGVSDKPKPKAFEDDEPDEVPVVQPKKTEKDKPRQIDLMLERLKQEQQERDEREAARRQGKEGLNYEAAPSFEELGMNPGSFDSGDPFTTNLYIGNMAPDIDEAVLLKEFGRFGAIGSVKVMWPRDEEQRRKGRNCGFVAFMKREEAAKAMEAMDGIILHDFELRIGWGKSVPLPAVPAWAGPNSGQILAPTATSNKTGFSGTPMGAAVPPPPALAAGLGMGAHAWSTGADRKERGPHDGVGKDIEVPIIEDLRQRFIIDSLALYVQKDGCAFEQLVMEEEQGNPEYAFLFDLNSHEHIYYRWRVYSLAEGDTLRTWRIEPFVMVEGGQRWLAPSMTAMALSAGTAAGKGVAVPDRPHHSHERPLSDKERDRFEDMLRNLTVERADIRAAMIFALDCADAGAEIVETLADALSLPETPIPSKIARLFLVSDILHNSTAPVRNASRYRGRFEAVLPGIFESLQEAYRSVETRITQEALRRHVLRVLRCWREKYVFGDDYLNGLQATFLQPAMDASALAASNPTLVSELEALTPEELERKCRLSGLSTKGGREAQMHRLLALDVYVNNSGDKPAATAALPVQPSNTPVFAAAPDADGHADGVVVVKEEIKQEVDVKPVAPVSRWTTIDEDEEKQQLPAVPISKWLAQEAELERQRQEAAAAAAAAAAAQEAIFSDADSEEEQQAAGAAAAAPATTHDAGATGGAVATPSTATDEKRRQKLRQVELACASLEAELEESGLSRAEVEAKVSQRRAELTAEVDASEADDKAAALGKWRSKRQAALSATPTGSGSKGDDKQQQDSSRDRDRDRDRDRQRERSDRDRERSEHDRDRDRERDRGRSDRDTEREREGSRTEARPGSSTQDAGPSTSSRDRDRDKDRDKDRDRERERETEREQERDNKADRRRSRSRSRDRRTSRDDTARDRDRDRRRSTSRDRKDDRGRGRPREPSREGRKERSTVDKDPGRDRDRERRSSRDGGRDRDKERSSREADRDREQRSSRKRSKSRSRSRDPDKRSRR